MRDGLGYLVLVLAVLGIFVWYMSPAYPALEAQLCPQPIRTTSGQLLSCDGRVTLVTPTPAQARRH